VTAMLCAEKSLGLYREEFGTQRAEALRAMDQIAQILQLRRDHEAAEE
jgi:hypothetical protein